MFGWNWDEEHAHAQAITQYCKCTYVASFFVLIVLVVPCEALHSWIWGGLDMRSECCYNLCVYAAPRLLTALTVDFHTIFVTYSSILFSTRSSVMIIPTGQVRVYFAGPEHPDPGECWWWEGGRRPWDNTLPWKSSQWEKAYRHVI